jgi:hypothetical protein
MYIYMHINNIGVTFLYISENLIFAVNLFLFANI